MVVPLEGGVPSSIPAHQPDNSIQALNELVSPAKTYEKQDPEQRERRYSAGDDLKIAVVSGGTRVKIDVARVITNNSEGTSGALIAEELINAGHNVNYVFAKGAVCPFLRTLKANPDTPRDAELKRIEKELRHFDEVRSKLDLTACDDFWAALEAVEAQAKDPDVDVVIMSLAGSDFGPAETSSDKISSDSNELTLKLKPLPKIISRIKEIDRDKFLVGFKYLGGPKVTPDQLIEAAYRSMLRDGQDLAVANFGGKSMRPDELVTYIITKERGVIALQRDELPKILRQAIEDRFSRQHYKTNHSQVEELPLSKAEVKEFLDQVKRLSHLALFNSYLAGKREEFGFIAKRTEQGTLITGRGSSKSKADVGDLALIVGLDEEKRTLEVVSTEKKASLNANIAHLILQNCPEVQYIVHAHIQLPGAVPALRETTPGTSEDWEAIRPLVLRGENVISQKNHGVLILLKDLNELIPLLAKNNIYHNRAELYDLSYNRFLQSPRFVELAASVFPKTAKILDVAAGTGDVSRNLYERGYTNLELLDTAPAMLVVAKRKLPALPASAFHCKPMQSINSVDTYDGITLRQAINYVSPPEIVPAFESLRHALKPGGKLLFNSFIYEKDSPPLARSLREEAGDYTILVQEGNLPDGKIIHHGQRSEIFNKKTGSYDLTYDLNSFYSYTREEFVDALKKAGFSKIEQSQVGRSIYFVCQK